MRRVDALADPWTTVLAGMGVVGGLLLLARGLGAYRSQALVADTSTSAIASIAAGEVRVSGVVEPAEMILVSLLQTTPCVYYRATVGKHGDTNVSDSGYVEERSIGFRVRDATGSMRVFPRDARFDAPVRFEGETSFGGDEPGGLSLRHEGSTRMVDPDREDAVADLLEVHDPADWPSGPDLYDRGDRRTYRELRLEPGDPVTIVGRALPFSDLSDPAEADAGSGPGVALDDPEVAGDLAEARASGSLADDAADAWGNAAIPGFGIGRPVSEPIIDPDADPLPLASPAEAARSARTFEIEPGTLVLAASDEVPLLVAFGVPGAIVARSQTRFLVGLLGAILAIASAMVLALSVSGGFAS